LRRRGVLPPITGETKESISERRRLAWNVSKMHPVFIEEQPPAQEARQGNVAKRVLLMVGVDRDVWTSVQHSTRRIESLSDGKEVLVADHISLVRASELAHYPA
jgi:hypothetical protein